MISDAMIVTPNWDKETWISSPQYIQYSAELLSEHLPITSESRVLDIGCGRGAIAAKIATLNGLKHPVEGIDLVGTFQETQYSNVLFQQVNALDYLRKQATDAYEGIILKQVFHLLPDAQRKPLLLEIKRCLKPSGKALILLMPAKLTIPLFKSAQQIFEQAILQVSDVLPLARDCGFNTETADFSFPVIMPKHQYYQMLRARYMSTLQDLADLEIEQGILELDDIYQDQQTLEFIDKLEILSLRVSDASCSS